MDDDLFDGALLGTAVLPVQFNSAGRRAGLSGERRLLVAVLEDAIRLYLKNPRGMTRERANAVREARRWIEAHEDRAICAYETICDLLEVNADALRVALRRAVSEGSSGLRACDVSHSRPVMPGKRRKVELAA